LGFGDLALINGRIDIVKMIHAAGGQFSAPEAFVVLALNDKEALAAALRKKGGRDERLQNFTLEQYAEKIGRKAVLAESQ
jgi:hypothetical protein